MPDSASSLGKVFVSYSHRDKQWLDRLRVHLKPLERESVFDTWDDTRIAAGQAWRAEIEAAIQSASAAVLLVSKDFLASDFIAENELPPLLEAAQSRGLTILPVILSPCRFEQTKSLSELQSVNSPSRTLIEMTEAEQDRVFVQLSDLIHAALLRPATEMRNKIQQMFREVDHEFEPQYRKTDSDPSLSRVDKDYFLGMWQIANIDKKRGIVLDELTELDRRYANERIRRDQAGEKDSVSDKTLHNLQRKFLQEELQRLSQKRDQINEPIKARADEGLKNLQNILKSKK